MEMREMVAFSIHGNVVGMKAGRNMSLGSRWDVGNVILPGNCRNLCWALDFHKRKHLTIQI